MRASDSVDYFDDCKPFSLLAETNDGMDGLDAASVAAGKRSSLTRLAEIILRWRQSSQNDSSIILPYGWIIIIMMKHISVLDQVGRFGWAGAGGG